MNSSNKSLEKLEERDDLDSNSSKEEVKKSKFNKLSSSLEHKGEAILSDPRDSQENNLAKSYGTPSRPMDQAKSMPDRFTTPLNGFGKGNTHYQKVSMLKSD